jgi:hypothetical protein
VCRRNWITSGEVNPLQRKVETLDDAFAVYFEQYGEHAPQPARSSGYDAERGGWVLENINGALALVQDGGEIVEPVYDVESSPAWVLADD